MRAVGHSVVWIITRTSWICCAGRRAVKRAVSRLGCGRESIRRSDMVLSLGFGFGGPPIEQRHHD